MIWDVNGLEALGKEIQQSPDAMIRAIEEVLKVRDRHGKVRPLKANAVQRAFEQKQERWNIVLKARQRAVT